MVDDAIVRIFGGLAVLVAVLGVAIVGAATLTARRNRRRLLDDHDGTCRT